MSTPDDLPWPELGNVSRGATRGNQGQKGVLGPPDRDGRCVLQLRVQPGVLCVKLNRQASEWYRMLDNEVNRALKLTKTYWRKARRRQDYDARADQDHMELHEWLQQLKDKTMSHLELLMQKGDIQGPPYVMPDEVEFTFLRKFVERQAAGMPHNPRLRNSPGGTELTYNHRDHSVDSFSPEPSDQGFMDPQHSHPGDRQSNDIVAQLSHSRASESPSLLTAEALTAEANSSKQTLQAARMSLLRAQKETQDSFMRYTSCLDLERQARQAVQAAEKRRDDIVSVILQRNQMAMGGIVDQRSRKSSVSDEQHHSPARYGMEQPPPPPQQQPQHQPQPQDMRLDPFMHARMPQQQKPMDWSDDGQTLYNADGTLHLDDHTGRGRKHSRTWDQPPLQDNPYGACEVGPTSIPFALGLTTRAGYVYAT